MNLNDFGTCVRPQRRSRKHSEDHSAPSGNSALDNGELFALAQWAMPKADAYQACGPTRRTLPPGAYVCAFDFPQKCYLAAKDLQVDDLFEFEDSLGAQIVREIDEFWSKEPLFRQHGFLHRRGYLLYGPQGCGKSSLVLRIVEHVIAAGHVAVFCDNPHLLVKVIHELRTGAGT